MIGASFSPFSVAPNKISFIANENAYQSQELNMKRTWVNIEDGRGVGLDLKAINAPFQKAWFLHVQHHPIIIYYGAATTLKHKVCGLASIYRSKQMPS